MREKDFDFILKEHFDTSNRQSMKTLLSLNENEQNQAVASLAAKLYQKIVDKVDEIDYGTIPASKGDITKIGNYQEMRDCMSNIRDILVNYKQDTNNLDIIDRAIENIKDSKSTWEKAFAVDCEVPIIFYNNIVLAIVSSVSLLIAASIDFISGRSDEYGNKGYQISFDRAGYSKTKDKLLFESLEKFNKAYAKGEVKKAMEALIKSNNNIKESANGINEDDVTATMVIESITAIFTVGSIVVGLVVLLIPILHTLVDMLYCARQSVADYFEMQAKLLQFNAEQLKYNYTKSEAELKKIYDKQLKIVERFRKISNVFAVKMTKSEKEAKAMIASEKKEKYTSDDLNNGDNIGLTSSIF